jgi:tetratricopeptide (TPR) repeat protein
VHFLIRNSNIKEKYRYNIYYTSTKYYLKKSLQINPNYTEAFLNIGITLRDLERYDEALNFTDKAISIDPSFLEAWLNRGDIFNELARYDEALASYDKAISFKPDCADAYWNKALSQLLTGNFEDGWKNYEYRWKKTKADPMRHQQFPLLTNISEISGKSVLVWSEQGYGDTIQFSRYTEKLIELKADVIFEVQKPLKTLLQNSFLRSKVISQEESTEVIHFQIPLVSLPLLFSTNFDDIPSANSYIRVDEDNLIYWKDKLNLTNTKKNIGVACSGDKNHLNDKNRSIDLSFFEPLADKANLFLIQKDLREKDRNFLNQHPDIKFLGEEIKSFNDSASIIQAMDLVISVDTSLAHLSGALGKSTLVLLPWNPEWRWLLERQDSPWYPTAKIFRQPNKDNWEAVIKEVIFHLNLDY